MFERGKINLGFVISTIIAGLVVLGIAFAANRFLRERESKTGLTPPMTSDEPTV